MSLKKRVVRIEVRGGVAECISSPDDVQVVIHDFDDDEARNITRVERGRQAVKAWLSMENREEEDTDGRDTITDILHYLRGQGRQMVSEEARIAMGNFQAECLEG
jgi:hypothetical protein